MKRILSVILVAVLLFGCTACSGDKPEQDTTAGQPTVSFREDFLAEAGKTEYKILVPTDAGNRTQLAASELISFFRQACYAELEIETEQQVYSPDARYISIGDNSFSSSAKLDQDASRLKSDGYHIQTKGNSIFICGGGDSGNLYGVYDLLNILFDLEFYSNDEIYFQRKLKVYVPELNYTENPDFDLRVIYTGSVINDRQFQQYTRTGAWEECWTSVGGAHTSYSLIGTSRSKVEAARKEHPDWFARTLNEDGTVKEYYHQLCFTNPEVIERLTQAVLEEVDDWPDRKNVMVGIEDNRYFCNCPECTAVMEQYNGCASAAVIKCVNQIAQAVSQHLQETKQDRRVNVVMFAYYGYLEAPVKQNEDGSYSPIDDSVVLAENASVMIAPIDSDYAHSYWETAYNTSERRAFQQWNALSDSIFLWTYTTNFHYMLTPYDAFNSMQENFRFWKAHSVSSIYAQGQYGNMKATGFVNLQSYLQSKLMWDVDADMEKLTDDYFDHYFKEAGTAMHQYYDELRAHYAYLRTLGVTGGIYFNIESKEYWSYALLRQWENCIEQAYTAIEGYRQTDPQTYQKLHDRICLESVAIRHLMATFYKGMFTDAEYSAYVKELKEDMSALNISRYSESQGLDSLPY